MLPLVLRAAGWQKAHAERVLRATINGFKLALTDGIATRRAAAEQFRFDDCWSMLKCLEELAVHCPQGLYPLFADGVVELTRATQNEAVHAALAWIVNELSNGRTPSGASPGRFSDMSLPKDRRQAAKLSAFCSTCIAACSSYRSGHEHPPTSSGKASASSSST